MCPSSLNPRPIPLAICAWAGRVLAAILALVWGAFFVEHLNEWVIHPDPAAAGGPAPWWVFASLAAHLAIVLGLVALWWRERLGVAVAFLGTIAFVVFASWGGRPPWLMLINLVPLALIAAPALLTRRAASARHPA